MGFHKCGTTSFSTFFQRHGFRVSHNTHQVCESIGLDKELVCGKDLRTSLDTHALDNFVQKYDVLTDNPFPLLYEYFDKNYSGSLFVLGTRPTDKWLSSMQRYFGTRMPALGHAIYSSTGNPCSDPEALTSTYLKHNFTVREYFSGHDNFLEFRIGEDSDLEISKALEDFVGFSKKESITFEKNLPN